MPLNETDKAWVREAIQTAQKTHGWGAFTRFIKEWSGFGAAVAIILFFALQWTTYVEFRVKTTVALEGIEKRFSELDKRLDGIDGKVAQLHLSDIASLSPVSFKNALPDIKASIDKVREQKQSVPIEVVNNIQQKLASTETSAAGYWPVAAEIISYHSELLHTSNDVPIKNCFPQGMIGTGISGFKNCIVDLDGRTTGAGITCTNCIVRYSGGRVIVTGFFINCIFLVKAPQNQTPDPSGQRLEAELLASDLKNVTVTKPT